MIAGYFVRSYEVWRETKGGRDEYGELLPSTWSKISDIPGRAYPGTRSQSRSEIFGIAGKVIWTFACSTDADVKRDDEIRFNGIRLSVKAVAPTSRGVRLECLCEELQ